MKITNIRVTPVNLPLELPLLWTAGLYPGTDKAIIEVETDEGIVGLGEVPSSGLARNVAAFAPPRRWSASTVSFLAKIGT